MKRLICNIALLTALIGTTWAPTAVAGDAQLAFGVRPAGFSINPDQFTLGVQAVVGHVKFARFAPSVDIGFGDNLTLTTFNFDAKMDLFSPPKASAVFYAGAGPTIAIVSVDQGSSDTEIGVSLLGGIKLPMNDRNYYNLEARFGIGDIPDFKILVGAMFGLGAPE